MTTLSLGAELSLADLFREAVDTPWSETHGAPTVIEPHTHYQRNIIGWAVDMLGIDEATLRWSAGAYYADHVWDGTPDPFVSVAQGLEQYDAFGIRAIGVESGTTTGKTFFAAVIVLWFLACFEDAIVITVAPKEDQLKLHVWKEITKLWPRFQYRFPSAVKSTLRIQMRAGSDAWGAIGFVAGIKADEESATKAQGFHAEHMLVVFEETPGIAPPILEAFKQTCRAPHNLRVGFGNPDNQLDALHQLCTAPGSRHVIISALDHPNIVSGDHTLIPGAVSRIGIQQAADEDGEDSSIYKSRVRGISPAESKDALIKLSWLNAAAARFANPFERGPMQLGPKALGVDVAQSEKGDQAATSVWLGAVCLGILAKPCPNATILGKETWKQMKAEGIHPRHVGVDTIGVGAATVNELDERCDEGMQGRVQRCVGSAKAVPASAKAPDGSPMDWVPDANKFRNFRAQMYWQLREDLRLGNIALADDPQLFRELTIIRFKDEGGVVTIEEKAEIRKRMGGKSPDRADALAMGNWVRGRTRETPPPPVGENIAPAREHLIRRQLQPARHETPRPAWQGWTPR